MNLAGEKYEFPPIMSNANHSYCLTETFLPNSFDDCQEKSLQLNTIREWLTRLKFHLIWEWEFSFERLRYFRLFGPCLKAKEAITTVLHFSSDCCCGRITDILFIYFCLAVMITQFRHIFQTTDDGSNSGFFNILRNWHTRKMIYRSIFIYY